MQVRFVRKILPAVTLLALSSVSTGMRAQTPQGQVDPVTGSVKDNGGVVKTAPVAEKPDPLKRRLSDSQEKQRRKDTGIELKGSYKTWLDQDVRWIITDEEAKSFKNLANDEERDSFIEQFWLRRNPNPESPENEFRDEHYARIAYANEHFAAGVDDGPRAYLYLVWQAGQHRLASFGRKLPAADGRGRRRNVYVPVRGVALPVPAVGWRQCGH